MASKHEFLVIIHDKPGMQHKRLQVRPTHLENIKPKVDAGIFKMGGALLNSIPADDDPTNVEITGSAIICLAQSPEEARSLLADDIYVTSGVWDLEKAMIYPYKCVFRNP
ncbi:dimeric alpha-beta barrel [Ophiocordyceps camponoti-floridani]|uniref:Dimeric alpha-beta barrel n=1 Tax=Ophiocordyceps camponoti-floridani TaxID=2030778 RepID=A0A8H4VBF5_9HYPO|nr:dimeric alpha-beta barrel [Ophiocordyceps camponoti-floridani]